MRHNRREAHKKEDREIRKKEREAKERVNRIIDRQIGAQKQEITPLPLKKKKRRETEEIMRAKESKGDARNIKREKG